MNASGSRTSRQQNHPADPAGDAPTPARLLSARWGAVQDAAKAVAILAGRSEEPVSQQARNFPVMIRQEAPWRRELAERAVNDLAAIMQPGVKALLAVSARGQDAAAPAQALWHEYEAARAAILSMVPETGALGPNRAA